ncbi:MAG: hypothetical protein E7592_06410 [Ruminococcaceae bacterium]|nr:hypothetical protein [Oscillospiraceae bacterium]
MFGYIRTDTPELRVRENEYYKAVYCGMCRAQGKCTGQCSRMTLSYDMVFLALLRLAISGEDPAIKTGRCIAHPFKKRVYLDFCDSLAYCAYASALLVWGKTADDLNDEKGIKKLKARLTKPLAKKMRKKALKQYAKLDEQISNGLKKLADVEKEKLPSVDAPADRFGELLADILSYGVEGDGAKILRNIGLHIGKWIYIVDAVDDLDGDLKNERFNPFICLYGAHMLDEDKKRAVATSLRLELLAAEPAFDLIEFGENPNIEGIIKNIIYRGMPDVADRVLELDGKTKRQGKKTSRDKKRKVK